MLPAYEFNLNLLHKEVTPVSFSYPVFYWRVFKNVSESFMITRQLYSPVDF